MTDFTRGPSIAARFIFGAAAWVAAAVAADARFAEPTSADKFAEADSVRARINEMQEQLTIAGENYYKALDEHEAAVQAVADRPGAHRRTNAQIAELQDKLSKRARGMYRSGQTTALDVILGTTDVRGIRHKLGFAERYQRQRCRDGAADERPARRGGGGEDRTRKSKSVSLPKKPKRRRASKLRQSRPSKRWKPRCNSLTPRLRRCWSRNRKRHVLPKLPLRQPGGQTHVRLQHAERVHPVPGLGGGLRAVACIGCPYVRLPPVRTDSTAPDW